MLGEDEGQLYAAIGKRSAWYLRSFLVLLVEMRRGELLSIQWRDVDFDNSTVLILKTKNTHPRRIPLTPTALRTLQALPQRDKKVFPVTPNAIRLAWERLRARTGLLRPKITWSGNRRPSVEELDRMHHAAHENCFIANSVKTNVTVAGR